MWSVDPVDLLSFGMGKLLVKGNELEFQFLDAKRINLHAITDVFKFHGHVSKSFLGKFGMG